MPELIPVVLTLEVMRVEHHLVAIDLDDLERDFGHRDPLPGSIVALIKSTPNWQDRFSFAPSGDGPLDGVIDFDIVDAEPQPVQAGEPPR